MTLEELRKNKEEMLKNPLEPIGSYDSPITIFSKQLKQKLDDDTDRVIMERVWELGVDIDKDKLVAALNQDHRRYEAAWKAGYSACQREYEERMLQIAKLTGLYLESEDEG